MKTEVMPIPETMLDLPRDHRGWPVTYTSIKLPDGTYDFTTSDHLKWVKVVTKKLCASCGKPLKPENYWFIGGPLCMVNRMFFDPAMHEECARYSMVVCPYLSMAKYLQAKNRPARDIYVTRELNSSNRTKPIIFGLSKAETQSPVRFQGDLLVYATEWVRPIEWFANGKPCNMDGDPL